MTTIDSIKNGSAIVTCECGYKCGYVPGGEDCSFCVRCGRPLITPQIAVILSRRFGHMYTN